MINVAMYLRKSREDDEAKGETLARHETMLTDYCARNHLNVVKIYREVVSGEKIANRPQMSKLLDDVSADMYDGVVCVEIERLSRGNPIDQCEILDVFKGSNTKIYTLNKIYDLTKEELDEEYFEFALFMSRREYKTIKRRLWRGKMQARNEGYYVGAILPYGFNKVRQDKGFVLVPNPSEIDIVKNIFNTYYNGAGVTAIARGLNEKGVNPRYSSQWSPQMIRNILHNKTYIGYIYFANEERWSPGKHDAVIDPRIFEEIQQRLTTTPRVIRVGSLANPFAGLLKCSCCGHTMKTGSNQRKIAYIRCYTLNCPNKSIKLSKLEDIVIDKLKEELKGFNYILDNYESSIISEKETQQQEIAFWEKELTRKNNMYKKACEMLEEGIYTIEVFKERAAALDNEIESINRSLEELRETTNEGNKLECYIPKLEKVIEQYYTLDTKAKNALLKGIIKRIEYTKLDDTLELDIELLI
jgi:DNA invertase Pin-like site-specific DNA recombinase